MLYKLSQNIRALHRPGLCTTMLWTNNNCESINHVLKTAVSWKSLKLVDLIYKLHTIVEAQFREVKRAFISLGEFVLTPEFGHFQVPLDVWHEQNDAKYEKHFKRFMSFTKEPGLVRSTSGLTVCKAPVAKGKKPGKKKSKK